MRTTAHTKNNEKKKVNIPAVIVSVVMLLYIGADYLLSGNYINSQNPYASVVVAQFCVFILPCAFFCAFSRTSLSQYNFRLFSPKMLGFVASCIPTLIFGGMLIKYLSYVYIGNVSSAAVNLSGNSDFLYILLSAVLVPAIAEEILLRGIVYKQYEKRLGAFAAIFGSSLLFALIHFDLQNFFSYFYAGIILGVSVHITRSLFAPMLLHFINNFVCIYSDAFLQRISKESISSAFVLIMLSALVLLSLFVFLETLEWICIYKADKLTSHQEMSSDEVIRLFPEKTKLSGAISRIVLAPAFVIAVIIYFLKLFVFV